MDISRIAGSYRDPGGNVYEIDNHIYRSVNSSNKEIYETMRSDKILERCIAEELIIETREIDDNSLSSKLGAAYILQHEKIPYISYPYEWSFDQLKSAALHHIKLHKYLLGGEYTLSDASAYNIQFRGSKPVFIDVLSIVPYKEGSVWIGYKQFCEQFLNPLLMSAYLSVHPNNWYRGSLEGVETSDLLKLMPLRHKLNWRVFSFLTLYNMTSKSIARNPEKLSDSAKEHSTKISKQALLSMLYQLESWIGGLDPIRSKTTWGDYAETNTYVQEERETKKQAVEYFTKNNKIESLIDLGCNTGDYSIAALSSGAKQVIGFDFDHEALRKAYHRSLENNLNFLPLWLDASNPSPSQGWMETERASFSSRFKADGVVALAFEHHLAIAKNIPLEYVISWIISLAPKGIIEFIPKSDSTLKIMLSTREDIFHDYNIEHFEFCIRRYANIIQKTEISKDGRVLYEFQR